MTIQRATKGDKKYVKGNNSKSVDYDAKQQKRRELAERIKRPAGAAETPDQPDAKPQRKKSS